MDSEIEKVYDKAIDVLILNSTEKGFIATHEEKNNYKRVWARDGVVQGIAGIMSGEDKLILTLKHTLEILREYQDESGRIASNINLDTKQVSYGTLVGKVDATLWYIIGVGEYYKATKNKVFLKRFRNSLKSAIEYLGCLEINGKGLLYIPTGGDWADEYITEGYVLFDQILYYIALREYESLLSDFGDYVEEKKINEKANFLEEKISVNYFPSKREENKKAVYNKNLYQKILKKYDKDYALIYFSSSGVAPYLDCFANSLLLMFDICSLRKRKKILDTLNKRLSLQKLKILPAFWPPITKNDKAYFEILKMNSLFEFRNKPNHYHNGGLWPLIQGFFIAGVINSGKRTYAKRYLEEFAFAMKKDNYRFHEFFESKGYEPLGVKGLGFSAAGYVIAYNCVIKNKRVFF